jgi:hypothetical protein
MCGTERLGGTRRLADRAQRGLDDHVADVRQPCGEGGHVSPVEPPCRRRQRLPQRRAQVTDGRRGGSGRLGTGEAAGARGELGEVPAGNQAGELAVGAGRPQDGGAQRGRLACEVGRGQRRHRIQGGGRHEGEQPRLRRRDAVGQRRGRHVGHRTRPVGREVPLIH